MRLKDLDSAQRAREWYHGLTLLPGAWAIVRVDGRSFSRLTSERYDKPFDERFSAVMVTAAENLLTELGGVYAYTESDEISVALHPHSARIAAVMFLLLPAWRRRRSRWRAASPGCSTRASGSVPASATWSTTSPGGRPTPRGAR
ncbi:hypothetical protein GCM10009558_043010 [Virgisporangium aurantiacum]